jgi:uncharacterized protein (TIGR02646 family)
MRPVRIPSGKGPPKDWVDEAKALTKKLEDAADDDARAALIKANEKHWRDPRIRGWLVELHHRKCWYTEAKESVSAYHVDHFRPKASYWWLAFEWENYRISGQLINVKKSDVFPVDIPGHARPGAPGTLKVEGYHLIDPVEEDAAWLLSFEREPDGLCLAGATPGVQGDDAERVRTTIEVLGLNRLENLNRNRAAVWDKCLAKIQDYENANKEPLQLKQLRQMIVVRALAEFASEEAEFSSVAWACIQKLAPQVLRQKVQDVLQKAAWMKAAA